jgi:hypothetical protein
MAHCWYDGSPGQKTSTSRLLFASTLIDVIGDTNVKNEPPQHQPFFRTLATHVTLTSPPFILP